MPRNDALGLCGLGVALALAAMPATAADTAGVEITATVPMQCDVLAPKNVVSNDPLYITASVERTCNATHTLSVTFEPATLSAPETLEITFDGASPTSSGSGIVTFGDLPPTNSTELLEISYEGTQVERDMIADTVEIDIAVP